MKKTLLTAMILGSFQAFAGGTCDNTNLNAWSVVTAPDAGALTVSAGSAMAGTDCGMEVAAKAARNRNFVQDSSPSAEQRYRAAFYVDPNGINLPTTNANRKVKLHMAQCTAAIGACPFNGIVQIKLAATAANGYVLDNFVIDGAGNDGTKRFTVDIPDTGATRIEYDVDLTTGNFKFWVNATSESDPAAINLVDSMPVDYTGLDMSTHAGVQRARLGFMNSPARVPLDEPVYVDEFESRRQTFIGQ
ncbi:hypothetical protein [Marinicella rhabdoformis]|uniref:hypothetical protein n=1 Tax=Marinicella rhabdoformis TaxID=2580566 RepID=UPI0012AEC2F5|nr:hypothetical protein [Marinicella rhabdoformis]